MSNNCSTFPISVSNSQSRQRRGSLGAMLTDLFAKQNNSPPASDLQGIGSNAPNVEHTVGEDVESASPGATRNAALTRRVSGTHALRRAGTESIGNGIYLPQPGQPAEAAQASGYSAGWVLVRGPPRSPAAGASSSIAVPLDERFNASCLHTDEGFNWTEALRSHDERTPSIGGAFSRQSPQSTIRHQGQHQRAASVTTIEQPIRETSKQFKQNTPDFFQEKILRGDFME